MFERLGGYPNKFFDFCGAEKIKKASIAGAMHSLLCEVYISVHCLQCENIYIGAQLAGKRTDSAMPSLLAGIIPSSI